MSVYGVLLFVHVLGAAVWLGGEVAMLGLRALALRSGDGGGRWHSYGTRIVSISS